MEKADGAFLTIGELAQQLGVAQHILRYWESRFPQLRPLQRAGNRRYYRPQDVAVAERIHRLLNVEGFTIKGAAKALSGRGSGGAGERAAPVPVSGSDTPAAQAAGGAVPSASVADGEAAASSSEALFVDALLDRLRTIRGALSEALEEESGQPS
ncbi:MerR family transcriptional regulator [Sphingobium sufflavum]|nr:MerR family transcriptional regulator [Sphingobium sufflavum]MCE7798814.1 MerR family transcriptional regulator [Sphingobium sufflavum]